MPINSTITSIKYFNQHKNGDDFTLNTGDFTTNLAANVMEKIRATIDISIDWFAQADAVDSWLLTATTITRTSGNFFNDGFSVGQVFDFITAFSVDPTTPIQFNGTVVSISTDGSLLTFTVNSGAPVPATYTDEGIRARGDNAANYLTALIYKYGLIENNETFTITSKVSGSDQAFYVGGITRAVTPVAMSVQGSTNDWINLLGLEVDSATVSFISESAYVQSFQIVHTFTVLPWFIEGELDNLQNKILPDLYAGIDTLKHAFQTEFRLVLSNPNTAISTLIDDILGSVGWFEESYNGFDNDYVIDSIVYEDSASTESKDSLQITSKTKATITLSKQSGSFSGGERFGLFVSYLPDQNEYTNVLTDLGTNFLYDNLYHTDGTGIEAGTGIITSLDSSIVTGSIEIVAEFEYTALQGARLTSLSNYLICVQIADSALSSGNSDKVNLLADVNTYDAGDFITGLIDVTKFNYLTHEQTLGVDAGTTTLALWNEDGIVVDFDFDLNLDDNAVLNTLQFKIVAHDPVSNAFFELDSYEFNLSGVVTSGGVQQIEITAERGYKLAAGSQFNNAEITTGALAGGLQTYSGSFGQKVSWQTWVKNLLADTVFFDAAEPNDNLNDKASNYSALNGYFIKLIVEADVSGVDSLGRAVRGTSVFFGGVLSVFNYDVSPNWTAALETFSEDGSVNLAGVILGDANTRFKITWTNVAPPVTSLVNHYGIHRIEVSGDSGYQIQELSSILTFPTDNILQPITGESFLKLSIVGGEIVSEGLIDYTKLSEGAQYNLSGRLKAPDASFGLLFENSDFIVQEDLDNLLAEDQ